MEFFNVVLQYASMGVTAFGGGIAISGIINYGEGKSQNNAGKQDEGMSKIVEGGLMMNVCPVIVQETVECLKQAISEVIG